MTRNQRCDTCNDKRYITYRADIYARARECPVCTENQCPKCHGAEYTFARDERGYRYALPCSACAPLKRRIKRFGEAHLPARYHDATIEHFETRDARTHVEIGNLISIKTQLYRRATSFAPGDRGFLLHGIPGCGKTHLLAAFIRYVTLEKGMVARFAEFSHLLSELRQQFDVGKGDTRVIAPLVDAEVLAIDELGKGVNNEWQLSVLDELISKRYNQGKTTLFTTNYAIQPPEFTGMDTPMAHMEKALRQTVRERIGERIYSRLHEMADIIGVDAPDYRRRAAVHGAPHLID